jgi:hypothetical protein
MYGYTYIRKYAYMYTLYHQHLFRGEFGVDIRNFDGSVPEEVGLEGLDVGSL